jgi:hypothetical protein
MIIPPVIVWEDVHNAVPQFQMGRELTIYVHIILEAEYAIIHADILNLRMEYN